MCAVQDREQAVPPGTAVRGKTRLPPCIVGGGLASSVRKTNGPVDGGISAFVRGRRASGIAADPQTQKR
jgi:hypothetical protein